MSSTSCERVHKRVMNETEEQWVVGFWEGDGACGTYFHRRSGLTPQIAFYQKDRDMLGYTQALLGLGNIYKHSTVYDLAVRGNPRCAKAFSLLCKYVVGRQSVNKINHVFEELGLSVRAQEHEPTASWIAGFFDAEGCVGWDPSGGLTLYIAQKDRTVLEKIQERVGGRIYPADSVYHLWFCNYTLRNSDVVPLISKFSHNEPKRQRLIIMLHVLARNDGVWGRWAGELVGGKEL